MKPHEKPRPVTVEWYTPAEKFIDPLGGWQSFDLDPCAPIAATPWSLKPHPFQLTARWRYCIADDGLGMTWWGRVFLNPPYTDGVIGPWLQRLAEHGRGTAVIFNRSDASSFQRHVLQRAHGILYVAGRVAFVAQDGTTAGKSPAPVVVCAYGQDDLDRLAAAAERPRYAGDQVVWSAGRIPGELAILRLPRTMLAIIFPASIEGEKINMTWRQVVAEFVEQQPGPFALSDLYQHARSLPKAANNRNVEAKVRQQVQRSGYTRVAPGVYQGRLL